MDAYASVDFAIIVTPTNYDPQRNFFDTSLVEKVVESVIATTADRDDKPLMIIKSMVSVGYTESVRNKYGISNIIFSPEFLRKSKALYDNLFSSRIIVSIDGDNDKTSRIFASLLQQGTQKSDIPTLFIGLIEAEAVKLFAKTYLALLFRQFD